MYARETDARSFLGGKLQEAAFRISRWCPGKIGYALGEAQAGETPDKIKPLRGFSGVYEIAREHAGDAYRAVYVVNLGEYVYVLHCFQKKSTRRIKTPKKEIDLIHRRLNIAKEHAQTWW